MSTEPRAAVEILEVAGEAEVSTSHDLSARLEASAERGVGGVVVDLSSATFIDSSTLGVLAHSCKRFRAAGLDFAVVCPPGSVRLAFELTALERVLSIHSTREEALSALDR